MTIKGGEKKSTYCRQSRKLSSTTGSLRLNLLLKVYILTRYQIRYKRNCIHHKHLQFTDLLHCQINCSLFAAVVTQDCTFSVHLLID